MREREPMSGRMTILDQMDACVEEWQTAGDGRAIFLRCYRVMTRNMLADLGEGFQDPAWVDGLLHRFAAYYFEALIRYENGDPDTPRIWTQAHDRSMSAAASPIVRLLLGVNAHINYDLVLTLEECLRPEWRGCTRERRSVRYADHCQVNRIIAASIDTVQDDILEPDLPVAAVLDVLMGPLDEYVISTLIANWRETVWQSACEMLNANSERERQEVLQRVEHRSLRIADQVWTRIPGLL